MRDSGFGRVMLIDSSRRQLEILKSEIRQYNGTRCVTVESARMAVELLKSASRVDVILVDWMGMDLDIFEFLPEVRSLSACVNSRIIVSGPGNMRLNIRESLLSTGADYYMIKPYKADTLFRCIEALRPVGHLPVTTIWDAVILRKLEQKGLSRGDVGYWYLGSCLQQWLTCEGIPQLKTVFAKVGEQFTMSDKGVESGVNRTIHALARAEGLAHVPTCKEWISRMADSIWLEYNERNVGDSDANMHGSAQ